MPVGVVAVVRLDRLLNRLLVRRRLVEAVAYHRRVMRRIRMILRGLITVVNWYDRRHVRLLVLCKGRVSARVQGRLAIAQALPRLNCRCRHRK